MRPRSSVGSEARAAGRQWGECRAAGSNARHRSRPAGLPGCSQVTVHTKSPQAQHVCSRCEAVQSCPPVCRCSWAAGRNTADCARAGLTAVPQQFRVPLQALSLAGNRLVGPGGLGNLGSPALESLQQLSLARCALTFLPPTTFSSLTRLTSLDLSHNNLTSLSPRLLDRVGKLETLLLSGNRLSRLTELQFPRLVRLARLDLSGNLLTSIHLTAFANLGPGLRSLDLRGNLLTVLAGPALRPLTRLQVK